MIKINWKWSIENELYKLKLPAWNEARQRLLLCILWNTLKIFFFADLMKESKRINHNLKWVDNKPNLGCNSIAEMKRNKINSKRIIMKQRNSHSVCIENGRTECVQFKNKMKRKKNIIWKCEKDTQSILFTGFIVS